MKYFRLGFITPVHVSPTVTRREIVLPAVEPADAERLYYQAYPEGPEPYTVTEVDVVRHGSLILKVSER